MKFDLGRFDFTSFDFSKEEKIDSFAFAFPGDWMLGKQAEYCFEYYLKHSTRYDLIAANLQIQEIKQTIGELDYIVFDKQKELTLHIELACKFYLYDPSILNNGEANWIGPNRKDTLTDKLNKLVNRQFPLLYAERTKLILKELKIGSNAIEQQLCLKSFLFAPKGYQKYTFPETIENCISGYWISFFEFISEDKDALYIVPLKKEWLLPLEKFEKWLVFSEVKTIIETSIVNKKSPLVYKKNKGKIERFFVVWW